MNIHAVTNKINEADFFFEKLKHSSTEPVNRSETEYYLSAFLSAARSFTFVLQKMCKHDRNFSDFEEWYRNQLKKLESYQFSEYFKEFRNVALKEGVSVLSGGAIYTNEDGEMVSEIHLSHQTIQFKNIKIPDNFLEESFNYLKILVSIYWDFLVEFGEKIDPWRIHTINFLKKNNDHQHDLIYSSIEDFEGELTKEIETNKLFSNSKPHKIVDQLFEKYLKINRFK
ncbi:MAG: hypothetical protein FH748_10155 [Balneolaceae bacterium]|nr:hypothetical protein [Balneolaceae bacterium]